VVKTHSEGKFSAYFKHSRCFTYYFPKYFAVDLLNAVGIIVGSSMVSNKNNNQAVGELGLQ
jgi:hypothetical protein